MVSIKKSVVLLLIGAACFAACSSVIPTLPDISIESFTTAGKPTKTVQTPTGDVEVYDPTQDLEVIAAFDYVKAIHRREGVEASKKQLSTMATYFNGVREVQLNDLARLGCKVPIYPGCGEGEFENTILQNCVSPQFGQVKLSTCEAENLKRKNFELIRAQDAPICYASFKHIGSDKRRQLKSSDLDEYFKSECAKF